MYTGLKNESKTVEDRKLTGLLGKIIKNIIGSGGKDGSE